LLRRSPRGISETAIDRDWNLLQQTMEENDSSLASRSTPRSDVRPDMRADVRGNRP
jgi:hypothetical protein